MERKPAETPVAGPDAMSQLAALLGRPADSYPGLQALPGEDQARLLAAIEASCQRHDQALGRALRRVLPGWLLPGGRAS